MDSICYKWTSHLKQELSWEVYSATERRQQWQLSEADEYISVPWLKPGLCPVALMVLLSFFFILVCNQQFALAGELWV